jgi:hypothetical protein
MGKKPNSPGILDPPHEPGEFTANLPVNKPRSQRLRGLGFIAREAKEPPLKNRDQQNNARVCEGALDEESTERFHSDRGRD